MTTEYRRNIPSVAHVEAAMRLGLLWHREAHRPDIKTKFAIVRDSVRSNYGSAIDLESHTSPVISNENRHSYRPIRPDGTPVDWEVLDQEVARAGQQGQPATVTPTAPAAPTTQLQGFRADLWSRICIHFGAYVLNRFNVSVSDGSVNEVVIADASQGLMVRGRLWNWPNTTFAQTPRQRADILARWTVYQELKPLYDLVDGAQGEAAMPRDVEAEWSVRSGGSAGASGNWRLCRNDEGLYAQGAYVRWYPSEGDYGTPLRNFAAVLDAVAERRVAERMQGQAPAVTSAVILPSSREQHRHDWIYDGLGGGHNGQYVHNCACGESDWFAEPMSAPSPREAVVRPATAQPEPRRFADVRPDRHGWRWWRDLTTGDCFTIRDGVYVRWFNAAPDPWSALDLSAWLDRTVIPTDEQGNPVSWESIGPTDPTEMRLSSPQEGSALDFEQGVDRANRAISQTLVAPLGPPPPVGEMTRGLASYDGPVLTIDSVQSEGPADAIRLSDTYTPPPGASGWVTLSGLHDSMRALPRFGLIELDDDDCTGQSRQAPGPTLRSGTIPTAAQVAKFRGVLSRKLDNTLTDAIKESKISCEVSQHVLQRWAGGLGDDEAAEMIDLIVRFGTSTKSAAEVDQHAQAILASWSPRFADLSNEPPRPTPSRGELEERRRRLAELQARLRAERAEQPAEELQEEPGRMALIEPDPAADPGASIRAWEERQEAAKAAAKLQPGLVTEREREPPRGPAVELVDATRLGYWLGRLYALANTDLPDTRLGARLGPRQRASG